MTNKQELRAAANAANIASWGRWETYKPHKGARGYEVKVGLKAIAQHCLKVDSVFIAAANPATVLALLDELEAAEKRIAELEARAVALPLPRRKIAADYVDDVFEPCDLAAVYNACRLECEVKFKNALVDAGVKVVAAVGKGE